MKLKIPPVIQVLITAIAMWIVSHVVMSFVLDFPGQTILAAIFAVAGLLIASIAIGMFAKAQTTVNPTAPSDANILVTTGMYQFSRNPMYLAMALLLAGWAIFLGSIINVLLLACFIQAMNVLQIKPEEAALERKFGGAYIDYCRRTRRWI